MPFKAAVDNVLAFTWFDFLKTDQPWSVVNPQPSTLNSQPSTTSCAYFHTGGAVRGQRFGITGSLPAGHLFFYW